MTSLYRNIIKEAWWITWRHKFLWFFGLFAALLSGEIEILFQSVDTVSNQQAIIYNLRNIASTGKLQFMWNNITSYLAANPVGSTIFIIIVLAIFVFVVWLVIVSQIGLIDSYFKLQTKQAATLESGFRAGRKYFIPVFLLNLLGRVIVYGLLVVIGIPLILIFFSQNTPFWNLVFIISFTIFILLAVIIYFIIKYAAAFVVFKQEKASIALKEGWKLFIKNWLISIEMAILILAIYFLFWVILIILAGVVSLPFILVGAILNVVGLNVVFNLLFWIEVIALFILFLLGSAFVSAFQWVAWVSLFKRLVGKGATSKIIRLFNRLPSYLGKT